MTKRAELPALAENPHYDDHETECANCGGEGFTYGCSWDWQCDTYDEGEGACLCERRCEWCRPFTTEELAAMQKYRDVLAAALRDTEGGALAEKEV